MIFRLIFLVSLIILSVSAQTSYDRESKKKNRNHDLVQGSAFTLGIASAVALIYSVRRWLLAQKKRRDSLSQSINPRTIGGVSNAVLDNECDAQNHSHEAGRHVISPHTDEILRQINSHEIVMTDNDRHDEEVSSKPIKVPLDCRRINSAYGDGVFRYAQKKYSLSLDKKHMRSYCQLLGMTIGQPSWNSIQELFHALGARLKPVMPRMRGSFSFSSTSYEVVATPPVRFPQFEFTHDMTGRSYMNPIELRKIGRFFQDHFPSKNFHFEPST